MFLSFPAGNEMFQFPAFPALSCCQEMSPGRFPDLGDLRIRACLTAPRSFSQLCHVLRRLWTPRHPPCTLCSLTTLFLFCSAERIASMLFTLPIHLIFKEPSSGSAGEAVRFLSPDPRGVRATPPRHPWWRRPDSNRRPSGCKPDALPAELRPRLQGRVRQGWPKHQAGALEEAPPTLGGRLVSRPEAPLADRAGGPAWI